MKITRIVFLCGCLLLCGGLVVSLYGLFASYWSAQAMIRQPVVPDRFIQTGWVDVDHERGRVGLELEVRSRALAPELSADGRGELVPLYRFPVDYRVIDRQGRSLLAQRVLVDATEGRALGLERSYFGDSQLVSVSLRLDPFITDTGPVRVEARLYPDRTFGAELDHAELTVHKAAPLPVFSTRGVLAAVIGMILMLLGVLGEFERSRAPRTRRATAVEPITPAVAQPAAPSVRRSAALARKPRLGRTGVSPYPSG